MTSNIYLLFLFVILIFLGVAFANMQQENPGQKVSPSLSTSNQETDGNILESSNRGKLLYENHCHGCHNEHIHNRASQKVKSIHDIRQWVSRWSRNLKLDWNQNDIDLVAEFLNQQFYRLDIVDLPPK